jgi:nucleoside-diphosphate-sugar epimerase
MIRGGGEGMPILVIGGMGFIGSRVTRRLAIRGEEVVCMDINPGGSSFADLGDKVKVMRGDVTQFDDVMRVMVETQPTRVINLSYLLGSDHAPHVAMRLNVLGMDNCFEAARLCGVPRVVYASSVAVNGQQHQYGERLVNEDDPTYGNNQYAMHKMFNEWQARDYVDKYGMSITGVRPANVTGPDKVRGSVDHVRCITEPARGRPLTLPYRDFMRLPIHVDDIAEIFVRVLLSDAPRYPIYNSGGTPISLGELADMVQELLPDAHIAFKHQEGGRARSGTYLVDNSRLVQEFKIEYPPFRQRMLQIINEIRRQGGLPPITR